MIGHVGDLCSGGLLHTYQQVVEGEGEGDIVFGSVQIKVKSKPSRLTKADHLGWTLGKSCTVNIILLRI